MVTVNTKKDCDQDFAILLGVFVKHMICKDLAQVHEAPPSTGFELHLHLYQVNSGWASLEGLQASSSTCTNSKCLSEF